MKAQEMQKRVDGQDATIKQLKKKLGGEDQFGTRPGTGAKVGTQAFDDAKSEFSYNSNDSEGEDDENFFDLRIMHAYLNEKKVREYLEDHGYGPSSKNDLKTLIFVDFNDHETQYSQLSEGFFPKYNTQITFRNKMSPFYLNYLLKEKARLEIYVPGFGGGNNIKLGSCELLLSKLVETNQYVSHHMNMKASVFEEPLVIVPNPQIQGGLAEQRDVKSIGTLHVKMRLRKPVKEQMRYLQNMNEIKDA